MQAWFLKQWQTFSFSQIVLLPVSWLFAVLSSIRRFLYQYKLLSAYQLSAPVVVVGNISVGGTGKTPLVILLSEQLKLAGYMPGIISRGYGGTQSGEVTAESNPLDFGDEPVLIAKRTNCPVWVNVDRVAAGRELLAKHTQCNIIISDDGLQHYRLKRDVEIVVVNAKHSLGNQQLLPAGPLREKVSRLSAVDAIVNTSRVSLNDKFNLPQLPPTYSMQLIMQGIFSLDDQQKTNLKALQKKNVVAIAGIGHPERFFNFVKGLGLQCEYHAFDDHHQFTKQDFMQFKNKTLLMTEKDAVKCKQLGLNNAWYLPVNAILTSPDNKIDLATLITQRIHRIKDV